jgi:hypothetical protein
MKPHVAPVPTNGIRSEGGHRRPATPTSSRMNVIGCLSIPQRTRGYREGTEWTLRM